MEIMGLIALSTLLAWASGINLYAVIFMLGLLASTGQIVLPEALMIVADPLVMTLAAMMYCIEFFADKIPGIDSAWDTVHTFIRIPAGALLAAGALAEIGPAAELSAALFGGSLAALTHTTKAGSRLLINTSPEPVSNWAASLSEDVLVLGGIWLALTQPLLFLIALLLFIGVMIWLLPKLWRHLKKVWQQIIGWFSEANTEQTTKSSVQLSHQTERQSGKD